MVATMKKGIAGIAVALALLASVAGLSMQANAAAQHQSSVKTVQLADGGPDFVCPPPPFECD